MLGALQVLLQGDGSRHEDYDGKALACALRRAGRAEDSTNPALRLSRAPLTDHLEGQSARLRGLLNRVFAIQAMRGRRILLIHQSTTRFTTEDG